MKLLFTILRWFKCRHVWVEKANYKVLRKYSSGASLELTERHCECRKCGKWTCFTF